VKRRIIARTLTCLVVYNFAAAAAVKLIGAQFAVDEFRRFGYPQELRIVIALAEFVGAALLLVPRAAPLATAMLPVILVGAVGSHCMVHEFKLSCLPLLLLAILGAAAYLRWGSTNTPAR
jgi:putative oxidoreductase